MGVSHGYLECKLCLYERRNWASVGTTGEKDDWEERLARYAKILQSDTGAADFKIVNDHTGPGYTTFWQNGVEMYRLAIKVRELRVNGGPKSREVVLAVQGDLPRVVNEEFKRFKDCMGIDRWYPVEDAAHRGILRMLEEIEIEQ